MKLGNGAIIEARSTQRRGQYLLGHDYDFFVFDEVAFEDEAEFVVNEVIKMRLADRNGKLDLISTPNGRNWFYRKMCQLEKQGRKAYIQSGDSRENRYISGKYLKTQMKYLADKRVAQNIMGQFVDSGGEIIPGENIDRALLEGIPDRDHYIESRASDYYITGWDLARKKTATVGITIMVQKQFCTVVHLTRIKKWDWNIIIEAIRRQQRLFPGRLLIDATGLGDVVVSQLADLAPTSVIFTPKTKAELLTNLELFHSMGKIKYHRWELPDCDGRGWSLEDELRSATWDDNNKCDALMAMALALWPLRKYDQPQMNPRVGSV
jgi:hypothetical protein